MSGSCFWSIFSSLTVTKNEIAKSIPITKKYKKIFQFVTGKLDGTTQKKNSRGKPRILKSYNVASSHLLLLIIKFLIKLFYYLQTPRDDQDIQDDCEDKFGENESLDHSSLFISLPSSSGGSNQTEIGSQTITNTQSRDEIGKY